VARADELAQGAGEKPRTDTGTMTYQQPDDTGSSAPLPPKILPPENTLTAMRLMMEPKKRGEGVTALVKDLAQKLEKSDEQLLAILASAGLIPPDSPKAKPTFAEHGGEIYWINVNAKGQVWLNAKAARKSRTKKPGA
jgi:hypothetical protein